MRTLFIGTGNMGSALIAGIKSNKNFKNEIFIFNRTYEKTLKIAKELNINAIKELTNLDYDIIVFGIKPNNMEELKLMLNKFEIKNQTFVTMVNAISIDYMQKYLGSNKLNIVRIMPNMNAAIGKSVTGYASNNLNPTVTKYVIDMFLNCGTMEEIPENNFSAFTALAGCSPSYIFTFLNGFFDYAINNGITKEQAYRIIKNTVIGSVEYSLSSNKSFDELINSINVPNGSTVEGQTVLNNNNFKQIVVGALEAAKKKS